ncbi:MAG: PrsW family intramembrane metalloprotease [Saprospiraceae bacterium]
MNILLIFLAILPGLVISFLIIRADRYEREPKLLMASAFILGGLITYPTMLVEGLFVDLGWEESRNVFRVFLFALLFVGVIEEFFKFICFGASYFHKAFNEPLDGIVYAVLIAMGFATVENIFYADQFGVPTIMLRAFTAVPAHGAFAVVMGYYVGLSKTDKKQRWKLILYGLGLASFLHGLYDFFIIQPYADWLRALATLVLIFSGYLAYRMVIILQNQSPFHPDNITLTNQEVAPTVVESVVPIEAPVDISPKDIPDSYSNDILFSAIDKAQTKTNTEEE